MECGKEDGDARHLVIYLIYLPNECSWGMSSLSLYNYIHCGRVQMWEIRHEAKYYVKSSVPVPDWHMPGFLKFFCLESQYFCVSPPLRLLITIMPWYELHMIGYTSSKGFSCMAVVVGIVSMCGLRIVGHQRYQSNQSKLVLYKWLLFYKSH